MIGETILHYKILEKLGEGGMGEVFKAQDTKLDRFVALKFLPSQLTASEDDKARFILEAKAASAMNHPNVCTIYDIQKNDGQLFIVMEFVDGKTLKDKKGSLSEKQILEMGVQVAEGLAAAHEKGIVHRDIKPENIMIRKDGIAQIMDFGLAKLQSSATGSRLTKVGTTMGTMGYMSPEQVQGLDVDHRSDIFSFGVVLYEMFAGESPFKGMHETAIMYEIVNVEAPPISTIKAEIDPELDEIILECLEKDKDDRFQSAKELAKDLRKVKKSSGNIASRIYKSKSFAQGSENVKPSSGVFDVNFKKRLIKNKISLLIISVLTIALLATIFVSLNSSPVVSDKPIHLSLNIGEGIGLGSFSSFAISPDGSEIVYVVSGASKRTLFLRTLDSYDTKELSGTDGAYSPFFSPDGKWLGFITEGKIKKMLISGGTVIDVSNGVPVVPYIFWGSDNYLYFTPSISGGIYRISSEGGDAKSVAEPDGKKGEINCRWPVLLPDGDHLMFTSEAASEAGKSTIYVKSLKTGQTKLLVDDAGYAQYINTGYIGYIKNNTFLASRFNPGDLTLSGASIPVIPEITTIPQTGQAEFSVSDNGTMIYLPGGALSIERNIVWVDHTGKILKSTDLKQPIEDMNLSPDGKKVAVTIEGTIWSIWIYDIERNTLSRLTYNADDRDPLWTPDGKSIVYGSFRDGYYGLFISPVNGSGKETMLVKNKDWMDPFSITSDGKYLAYTGTDSLNSVSIYVIELKDGSKPEAIVNNKFNQWLPSFSPDNKYIAYESFESGREEVYVIPFKGSGSKTLISNNGGTRAIWSHDGRALYYIEGQKLMKVNVNSNSNFSAGKPELLFSGDFWTDAGHYYDETPGTKNFVMIKQKELNNSRNYINVILNWNKELKSKLANAN